MMRRLTQKELMIGREDIELNNTDSPLDKLRQEINKRNKMFYHSLTELDEKVDQIQIELGIKKGKRVPQETRLDKIDTKLDKIIKLLEDNK